MKLTWLLAAFQFLRDLRNRRWWVKIRLVQSHKLESMGQMTQDPDLVPPKPLGFPRCHRCGRVIYAADKLYVPAIKGWPAHAACPPGRSR